MNESAPNLRAPTHEPGYVAEARRDKHQWWRYVLGMLVALVAWLIVGSTVSLLITYAISGGLNPTALDPVAGFVVTMAGFPFFLAGLFLTMRVIHRRTLRSLVTHRARIDWTRVGQGFLVWLVLWSLGQLCRFLLDPGSFSVSGNLAALAVFVPFAVVLTAVQTTTEELFFRGYTVQTASLIWGNRIFLALISAVLFTLPHLTNPEAAAGGWMTVFFGYFLGTGVVWAAVSLLDGTTELAIGAHFANNIANVLLVGTSGSIVGTPALFMGDEYDPVLSAVITTSIAVLFTLIVLGPLRRRERSPAVAAAGEVRA